MRTKLGLIGLTAVAVLATAAGLTLYAAPGEAVTPAETGSQAASEKLPRTLHPVEVAQAAQPTAGLPGGASSLNETYKDWQVSCVLEGTVKHCALSQSQSQKSGPRVLTIELDMGTGNTVAGALVLPFGLALESGAALQVDDKSAGPALHFRTCVPAGCVVPLSFDPAMVTALRSGTALKVKTVADGGKETPFSISLQGFATALDRVAVLSK